MPLSKLTQVVNWDGGLMEGNECIGWYSISGGSELGEKSTNVKILELDG